jgi:hypothetical protein
VERPERHGLFERILRRNTTKFKLVQTLSMSNSHTSSIVILCCGKNLATLNELQATTYIIQKTVYMTSFSTIKTNTYDGSNQARQRDSCCPDPCNIWHPHCPFCVFFICIDRCRSFLAHAGGPRVSNPSVVDCELCRVLPNIPRHLLAEVRRPLTAGRSRTMGRPPVISDAWFRVGTGAFSPAFFFLCPQHRAKKKVSVRAASRGRMPACRATDQVTCSALDGESCWSGDRVWSVECGRGSEARRDAARACTLTDRFFYPTSTAAGQGGVCPASLSVREDNVTVRRVSSASRNSLHR